ncbi:hypothetical protein Tco_0110620 [Tanacetum coccineum]
MQEAIEFTTKLVNEKTHAYAERQAEKKRKYDDLSKNNQNQQQHNKRQNTGQAYTAGNSDRKSYTGSKPLCSKCNYNHEGPCPPRALAKVPIEVLCRLVPSCFVIFDLEPLSLSLDFFEHEHVVMNLTSAGMRHHHLHLYIQRISLTGFPAQSVGSSNTDVLDLPCLLVLITGTSQSRQHVDTSLIHIESRKSPTAVLFDDDTGRISIRHCEY